MLFRDEREYRAHIADLIEKNYGSRTALCRKLDVPDCTLSRFLSGERVKTSVEGRVLSAMGLKKRRAEAISLI